MPVSTIPFSDSVRRFLEAAGRFGTLATVDPDGGPHQAVVWYLVTDDALVVNSAHGRRWPANLRREPRCSIAVEAEYDYVVIKGEVDEVIDEQARAQADIAAMARHYHDAESAERDIARFRIQRRVSFILRPQSVFVHGGIV